MRAASRASEVTKSAIGAHSRPLRFFVVAVVVAIYIALGLLLHTKTAAYTLLGVPITLAFQWGIQRRPLLQLWVRSGPALQLDARFFVFWILFSLVPAYDALTAMAAGDRWAAVTALAAIVGAFGLSYALLAMRVANMWQLIGCLLTAGGIAVLPLVLTVVLPHVVHLRIAGREAATTLPSLQTVLHVGVRRFFLGPVGFVVEEVFFRGALDTYVHRGEEGTGWLSAIFISGLWGLWHLPGASIPAGRLTSTIAGLVFSQMLVGVPLSYWWRKSGNLVVTDTTHAFLEALRSVVAVGG